MRFFGHILSVILLTGFILVSPTLLAQESHSHKHVPTVIRSWQMNNDYGIADSVAVDTMPTNLPMRDVLQDKSISWAYNGNLISPTQSKIYFDRSGNGLLSSTGTNSDYWVNGGLQPTNSIRPKIDNLFGAAYEPYIFTPQDVRYYRTTVAYSEIAYKKSFKAYHNENDLHFSFTGNINKRTNLGTVLNYLTSPGHYANQEGKVFSGYVFGSYDGPNYGLHATVTFNSLKNFENGGIQDITLLGGSLKSEDLAVNIQGMSGFGYIAGFLDHHYSITKERDSVEIPVVTFNHVFEVNNSNKRYVEKTANQGYFQNSYLNPSTTSDTANVLNIRNTLGVTLNEEFNRIMKFGTTVYLTNECQRYMYKIGQRDTLLPGGMWNHNIQDILAFKTHLMPDTIIGSRWVNNTLVGGSIYKKNGKWIKFGVNGDICFVGYKIGEFQVNGHVDATIPAGKDSLIIRASAYIKNETPSWYAQHYRSNHYIWDNDFSKTYRFYVGGEVCYPSEWIKARAKVGFENVTKPIYFNHDGYPVQMEGNIQVIAADLRADVTTPWVNLENSIIYQFSSSEHMPLPALTLYHNLYYHGWWFKAMYAQMGIDLRFHTKYYAPVLNPATGQFCEQNDVKIGNYPVMNLYANFYVKHLKLRFFAQWQNFNYLFMKGQQSYLHMPDYAMNPAVFRAGAAWHFWR